MQIVVHNPSGLPLIDYRNLVDLQGDFKDLKEENYNRLKKSLMEMGFFVPFFVWPNPEDNHGYLLDGHQRHRVLMNENATPHHLPYVIIKADNLKEAKKRLLAISSQFGSITQEGFDEFTFDLDEAWLKDSTSFDALFKDFPINSKKQLGEEEGNTESSSSESTTKEGVFSVIVECVSQKERDAFIEQLEEDGYTYRLID